MTDKVKTVQLINGVDLLGSQLSLNTKRGNELTITEYGIRAKSDKNGRVVLVPWTNIKGIEMFAELKDKYAHLRTPQVEAQAFAEASAPVEPVQARPRGRPKGS